MCRKSTVLSTTLIIFFPFEPENVNQCYLMGDFESFDDNVKIFFTTQILNTNGPKSFINIFRNTKWGGDETNLIRYSRNWIYLETEENVLTVKTLKVAEELINLVNYHILWINYDFKIFSQCEILSPKSSSTYCDESYFKFLKDKIDEKTTAEKIKRTSYLFQLKVMILSLLNAIFSILSNYTLGQFPITKYLNVALHFDNYLNGVAWAIRSAKKKKKLDIKIMNLLLSILLDMFLGILFLNWLNSKVSLESFPTLFLISAESVINSIKDLIYWLRGDPAGLKLNWAFNKVLSTFFSFHIEIWWTFLAFLEPLVKLVFQIFLKIGLLGITFQACITADLLALVTFHVYFIYAYAAKLYSIQISCLISLWRLFLGRKKNPLREKVDSCTYSPEQLFVGTLGFTILLFLLPTTLLYYIVFTCIRLLILFMQGVLMLIRHINQILPVYSTLLWMSRSSKVSTGIEVLLHNDSIKSNFLLMTVKPVTYSWWETVCYFKPDCAAKPAKFDLNCFLSSLISGKPIYPFLHKI